MLLRPAPSRCLPSLPLDALDPSSVPTNAPINYTGVGYGWTGIYVGAGYAKQGV